MIIYECDPDIKTTPTNTPLRKPTLKLLYKVLSNFIFSKPHILYGRVVIFLGDSEGTKWGYVYLKDLLKYKKKWIILKIV